MSSWKKTKLIIPPQKRNKKKTTLLPLIKIISETFNIELLNTCINYILKLNFVLTALLI